MELIAKECDVLGTKVWVKVVCENDEKASAEKAVTEIFIWVRNFEQKYSRFIAGNFLANLNARIGEWVQTADDSRRHGALASDAELFELLKFAEDLKKKTGGAFDLSVKEILENWGYDAQYSFKEKKNFEKNPEDGRAQAIKFSEKAGKKYVKLSSPIELGGVGKGYAVDKMGEKLQDFPGFFINAGGDILTKGRDENGKKWRIYFEHPTDPQQVIGFVDAENLALACSSPSKRKWRDKHHLVDPLTKKPADKMLAVYTQAGLSGRQGQAGLLADAYATALFVMGYRRAREFLVNMFVRRSQVKGSVFIEAMLVDVSGEIFRTDGFQGELFKG